MLLAQHVRRELTRGCSGIQKELQMVLEVVKDKQDRGTAQRYAEAMGDSEQVLECYRRITGHLERLTVSLVIFSMQISTSQAHLAQCKSEYVEGCRRSSDSEYHR